KQLLADREALTRRIRDFAAPRYREGYEKGIHDHDAALILARLLPLRDSAGLLSHTPMARGTGCFFWNSVEGEAIALEWPERASTSRHIKQLFGRRDGLDQLEVEIASAIERFAADEGMTLRSGLPIDAARYLVYELAGERIEFVFSKYARQLLVSLQAKLEAARVWDGYVQTLERLQARPAARWALVDNWLRGLCDQGELSDL